MQDFTSKMKSGLLRDGSDPALHMLEGMQQFDPPDLLSGLTDPRVEKLMRKRDRFMPEGWRQMPPAPPFAPQQVAPAPQAPPAAEPKSVLKR